MNRIKFCHASGLVRVSFDARELSACAIGTKQMGVAFTAREASEPTREANEIGVVRSPWSLS